MSINLPDNRSTSRRFVTVRQIPQIYPSFSISSVHWLIGNSEKNGFSYCLCRIGRKILIDLDQFERWMDKQ